MTLPRRIRLCACGAVAAAFLPGVAAAQYSGPSSITLYLGGADVTKGYDSRQVEGAYGEISRGDLTVHFDFASVQREDDGVYGALGVSWQATPTVRPKLMAGTSSDNFNILPEVFASASLQIKPASAPGWIVNPMVIYRRYRSGGEETRLSLEGVRYLKPGPAGDYWVLQGSGAVSFTSASDDGYSIALGAQDIRKSGVTLGLSGEGGRMTYDSLLGIGVRSNYWAARPSVGYRFDGASREVFLRGEYAHTEFYDVRGLTAGLKLGF